jgi:hypothetical protein
MYKFFCFKIELKKIKADSYMLCKAMAHSTKYYVLALDWAIHCDLDPHRQG